MSRVLTASEIGGLALRAIGQWPITESAPDGEMLREALTWLDLNMAELVGTERVFAFVPATLDVPITNGTQDYDLEATLGADLPVDKIQFPVAAWLEDGNGNRTPLEIATRQKFESVSRLDESGAPCRIWIDRLAATPTLHIFPTPAVTDTNTYTIKLDVQTYAPNVAPTGVSGSKPSGTFLTDFAQAWQRWLVLQLSADLGSGPVIKLQQQSIDNFTNKAGAAKVRLLAFENREQDTEPPICEAWGM